MKKILAFLLLFVSASVFGQFDKNWSKVENYENLGRTKSAFSEVKSIYRKAKRDKNEPEIIKCFFYKSKYLMILDEEAQRKIMENLKTEIGQNSLPSKAILNLVYARCLQDYKSQNYDKLWRRTKLDSVNANDFMTWTNQNFDQEIKLAYQNSLKNRADLKNILLKKYDVLFSYGDDENSKFETLYEYVLDENIAHHSAHISMYQDADNIRSYGYNLFGSQFKSLNFDKIKDENLKTALKLRQEKEQDFSNEKWMNRLTFIQNYLSNYFENRNEHYLKALNEIQKNSTNKILIQEIQLEKAKTLMDFANKKDFPDNNILAIKTLDSVLSLNNRSIPYKNALNQREQILEKMIEVKIQKYCYPNENVRAFVQFKNVDSLNISFYKVPSSWNIQKGRYYDYQMRKYVNNDSIFEALVKHQKPVKTHLALLPNQHDYFQYSTEILLPQMEKGTYVIHFETLKRGKKAEHDFTFATVTYTDFMLSSYSKDNRNYYQVTHRKTGKPISNVEIKSDKFFLETDGNGLSSAQKYGEENYYNLELKLSKAGDTLHSITNYSPEFNRYKKENYTDAKMMFYFDRAIYRPGQTVYYKGIAVQNINNTQSIVPNVSFEIIIEDDNGKELKKYVAKTNEFGSISGEFLIPKDVLTGEFSVWAQEPDEDDFKNDVSYDKETEKHLFWDEIDYDDDEFTFKVEEYKRPKFEVVFNPIKENIAVNKNVVVTGKAKAFAGSNVTDSKVVYKIVRKTYTNFYRSYHARSTDLAHGEVTTDAQGNFKIEFLATPDSTYAQKDLPVFNYEITADVTDMNGETQSSMTTVRAGYHTLELKAEMPNSIETKEKNFITFNSTNLNGEFTPVNAELEIFKLSESKNKFKPRVFPIPEIATLSSKEFETLFPDEDNEKPNEKGRLVFSKTVNTEKTKELLLSFLQDFKTGDYRMVFKTKDEFGNEIETLKNFKILQSNDEKVAVNQIFTINQINANPEKDGFVEVELHSNVPELYVFANAFFDGKTFFEKSIVLKNKTRIKISFKKEYRQNVQLTFETVFENQNYLQTKEIILKQEKDNMNIEIESFRSKIEPGSKENWSFKIKENNKVTSSEVLASMYDSSLDKFTIKDWEKLNFTDNISNYFSQRTFSNLGTESLHMTDLYSRYFHVNTAVKPTELMWFGFNFGNNNDYEARERYETQIAEKRIPEDAILVHGIVTDASGNPLVEAKVYLSEENNRKTTTEYDGYFQIKAKKGEQLVFSAPKLGLKIVTVSGNEINVTLVEDKDSPTMPVVILDGTVSEVKADLEEVSMLKSQSASVIQVTALAGKISGIEISGSGDNEMVSLNGARSGANFALFVVDGMIIAENSSVQINNDDIETVTILKPEASVKLYGTKGKNGAVIITTKKALEELTNVKARKNLSETAFFYPNLRTDETGKVSFNFTSPEALTKWKLRLFSHNKKANSAYLENYTVTQKDLMVIPNLPRFLRKNDTLTITTKIANLTSESKQGMAVLQLFDAVSMEKIDVKLHNIEPVKNFSITAKGNTAVSWKIIIPEGLQGVQYKILAKAGNFSDGEENILPVMTNSMLVTETIPLWVREKSTKEFTFENLKNNISSTLRNHNLTLEYTSNPAWIAIQSLPYIIEYEHECAEQTFARFYGNTLASEIINSNPKIAEVFETWRKSGKPISKLNENEELKSILLAETPWVFDAESDEQKKKNLAQLFDLEKMKSSLDKAFEKLVKKQKLSGGFVWFDGGNESDFITRHIVSGLGHLEKLKIRPEISSKFSTITRTAVPYIDSRFVQNHKYYEKLNKNKKFSWPYRYTDLHYLYARSFYAEKYPLTDSLQFYVKKYTDEVKKDWTNYSVYEKGLSALILNRFGEASTAKNIVRSLKETASNNEEWGMYWIENSNGYYWYQSSIETQALLIEAFSEVENDKKSVDAMKVWLLKNKQSKNWPTTKSTTEAVYALLMQGTDFLSLKDKTVFKIGNEKILTKKLGENEKEAGTGYVKMNWKPEEINASMAKLTVVNKNDSPGFGGFYWQYFEDLDKIKGSEKSVMTISKELYLKKNTDKGEKLQPITAENSLKIGDLVTIRLVVLTKEDMEFVHLKDMRASCFEPKDVISGYEFKDGLGFYKSTKDLATHFFFDEIKKGTYVLEYDVRVTNLGNFSNGITTIQSMYAPEYSSHAKGIRVKVLE